MRRGLVAAVGVMLCVSQPASWAGDADLTLHWSELDRAIRGKKIALVLPDGTHIQGKIGRVETDALQMRVSKTSNRKVVGKGDAVIPRGSVSVIQVTDYRKLGRILGVLGAVGASAIAVAANDIDLYEGTALIAVPAAIAAGTVGLGVAGYYVGKRIDKSVASIRVLPE